jgi:hypothetical protein
MRRTSDCPQFFDGRGSRVRIGRRSGIDFFLCHRTLGDFEKGPFAPEWRTTAHPMTPMSLSQQH